MSREEIKKETQEQENARVAFVLEELKKHGIIDTTDYDRDLFLEYRALVKENFFVFWTAIYPPMEHLLYALSYIIKPKNLLGLGIFTGNPVVWSMGPGIQQYYDAEKLVAVEIDENNARLCRDNFDQIKGDAPVTVLGEDGFDVLDRYGEDEVDLLYLDAAGVDPETGVSSKRINYSFLKKGYKSMKAGSYAICHNATMESFKKEAGDYLVLTDDDSFFQKTASIHIDDMGLEVSKKI
ncbi:MAG: hypothetical protein ACFFCS_00150 [Candidatus Hodarchaeota archaeon]